MSHGWGRNAAMRATRAECGHPNRRAVVPRSPGRDLAATYGHVAYRCPDCGLRWTEKEGSNP